MVSCTSAFLLVVALKCLVPVDHFAYLPNLAADLESDAGSILGRIQQHETKWQKCGCITCGNHQLQQMALDTSGSKET